MTLKLLKGQEARMSLLMRVILRSGAEGADSISLHMEDKDSVTSVIK